MSHKYSVVVPWKELRCPDTNVCKKEACLVPLDAQGDFATLKCFKTANERPELWIHSALPLRTVTPGTEKKSSPRR